MDLNTVLYHPSLTPRQRDVIGAVIRAKGNQSQAARDLDCHRGTVYRTVQRAIGKIKEQTTHGGMTPQQHGSCAELAASCFFLRQGIDVFRNFTHVGPIDMMTFDPVTGETTKWDVKSWSPGSKNVRKLTPEQKRLGVRLLYVNPETTEVFPDRPPRQVTLDILKSLQSN